jgi:transcriptional repressor NrdR
MRCRFCDADDTRVVDSRPAEGGAAIRRRRACEQCGNRFTTYERHETAVMVRKRDGSLEPFSQEKMLAGVSSALADRPVSPDALEALVTHIEAHVHQQGAEVTSDEIGQLVLAGLRGLDEVAYVRFASVYKGFEGASDFEREVAALEKKP